MALTFFDGTIFLNSFRVNSFCPGARFSRNTSGKRWSRWEGAWAWGWRRQCTAVGQTKDVKWQITFSSQVMLSLVSAPVFLVITSSDFHVGWIRLWYKDLNMSFGWKNINWIRLTLCSWWPRGRPYTLPCCTPAPKESLIFKRICYHYFFMGRKMILSDLASSWYESFTSSWSLSRHLTSLLTTPWLPQIWIIQWWQHAWR